MTRPRLSGRSLDKTWRQFLEKSTCTFVPDSPAMYLGNDDEGGKIRLRPKLNNPYPMLGEPSL